MKFLKGGLELRREVKPPVPLKGNLDLISHYLYGFFPNVEMEDLKAWNCIKAPLLLQMEKEMEDEVK